MSNVVTDVITAPVTAAKQTLSWAKARPFVFGAVVLVAVMLAIRYRSKVASFLTGLPVVGGFFAKVMNVSAAAGTLVALTLLTAGDAQAAVAVADAGSSGGILGLLLGSLILGSVFFPMLYPLDLKSEAGLTQEAITPGTGEVARTFLVGHTRGKVNGAFIKIAQISIRNRTQIDQPASGGATINWDELPRICAGLEIVSPDFGTMLEKEAGAGPILKHIIEFIGSGYKYAGDGARAQIAAADGDTAVDVYFTYPLAQRYLERPHDTAFWIGFLDQTRIIFSQQVSTALDAVSTGAVLEATTNLQMSADYFLDNDAEVPVCPVWRRHLQNANGLNAFSLRALGTKGPQGTKNFERLAGLYDLMDQAGMGGADGADNILRIACTQLGIERTTGIDFLVKNYLQIIGPRGPKGGVGASTPLHDNAGNPFTMGATPNALLNATTLMYLALRAPGKRQEITKLPKFRGDFEYTKEFTTTPTSGNNITMVQSLREFTPNKRAEMWARMGVDGPEKVPLADGQTATEVQGKTKRAGRAFLGLPRAK